MVSGLECQSHAAHGAPLDAPPLLFVHGAYCAAWVWEEYFLPWFAQRGWNATAISLEGHGDSRGVRLQPDDRSGRWRRGDAR